MWRDDVGAGMCELFNSSVQCARTDDDFIKLSAMTLLRRRDAAALAPRCRETILTSIEGSHTWRCSTITQRTF